MNTIDPFDFLLDLERCCQANASGLPTLDKSDDEWVGIGFRIGEDKLIAPMSEIEEILDRVEHLAARFFRWERSISRSLKAQEIREIKKLPLGL